MSVVEKIREMEGQGMDEYTITQHLQEQGFSPKEINEGLEQSKVKSAVSQTYDPDSDSINQIAGNSRTIQPHKPLQPATRDVTQTPPGQFTPGRSPQLAELPAPSPIPESQYQEPSGEYAEQFPEQYPEPFSEEPYPAQYGYNQYGYGGEQYPEYQASDTETISEIAEQVADEKLGKLRRQINEMIKFKTETEGKTSNTEFRLRKIEAIIDLLQASILKKIGEYGQNIEDLKKETISTQESFSKILDPMSENIRKLKRISKAPAKKLKTAKEKPRKRTKKTKASKRRDHFEKYLRK